MSTPTLDNHKTTEPSHALDTHDLEAMQQIINQAAHAMAERIIYLDAALNSISTSAETNRDYTKKLEFRAEALTGFAHWITSILEDPDVTLDYGHIRARAAKALNAWPNENGEATA